MAGELKNLSGLFKNTRTRAILIVTIGLLVLGIIAGIVSLKKRIPGPSTNVELQSSPSGISSVPGGFEQPQTAEYAKLQTRQNIQQAEQAELSGGSAVPTIISSSTETGGWQGGGFSSLNQPQAPLSNDYLLRKSPTGSGGKVADSEALPVYDPQGKMTGLAYGNANGNLCIVGCTTTGSVSPDGLIRDVKGNIIGKVATSALGTPVYDAQGRLVGYAGADGKVRDLKGNPIGTIGPNGVFKTNAGQVGGAALGVPVYNSDGRLVGYSSPDGTVRGLNGNVAGKLGSDGIARDAMGREIGKAGSSQLGTPVYDTQGRSLGYMGSDAKVRDLNGNVLGLVGADGLIRDTRGKILGKAPSGSSLAAASSSVVPKGSPVYDAQGRLLGLADPGGVVRNPNGKIIGNLAADGSLRDANGNVIGTVGAPPTVIPSAGQTDSLGGGPSTAVPLNESDQLQAVRLRQAQQLEQQKIQQNQQQVVSSMTSQQNLLFAAWATAPTQQYVEGDKSKDEKSQGARGGAGSNGGVPGAGGREGTINIVPPPFVKAGAVLYAVLTTGVNSDEPGPVMATIIGSQFRGAKLLGTLVNQGQKVMLTFNVLTLPDIDKSISINAVAIDPNTARTALSSDTDNHYLLRYGSLLASALMQGYGQAILQSGSTVVSNGLNTVTTSPTLSNKQQLLSALGTVGQNWGAVVKPIFSTPPTVQVFSGTALGILFLADVAPPTVQ